MFCLNSKVKQTVLKLPSKHNDTNRGQSPLQLPLPIVTSLSHKLQHGQHACICLASQLYDNLYVFIYAHTHAISTIV